MGYNADGHVLDFHNERVFVNQPQQRKSVDRREANRTRLKNGLDVAKEPKPVEFVVQGSYAMSTMVQSEIDSSDIDDGVVFDKDALKGNRGGDRTAYDARCMIRDAINIDDAFKDKPEVRSNCVRVFYSDGFHVDLPVYREYQEGGQTKKELASGTDWRASRPEDITEWFNKQVVGKSPDDTNGRQMRRLVRLVKAWSKSRSSWSMPSGFVISVLVDEAYPNKYLAWLGRDDLALLQVMRAIRNRLLLSGTKVYRPVNPRDEVTNERTVKRVESMRDELKRAIEELSVIEQADCDELKALKALAWVFNTDHFDARIAELSKGGGGGGGGGSKAAVVLTPAAPVKKQGGTGQYG